MKSGRKEQPRPISTREQRRSAWPASSLGCTSRESFAADAVVNMMRKACRALPNVTVLDGWSFVPAQKAFFSDFYLHPNDIGFYRMAETILPTMQKMLGNPV